METGSQSVDWARAILEEGDLDRARDAYRQALEAHPDDVDALVDLGYLCFGAGEPEEALGYFRRALERDPTNAGALRGLVDAHRRRGSAGEALEAAAAALQAHPQDVVAALDAAELALELGRLLTAEAAFRRARAADDPDHEVYLLHALIEVELRREDWRKALDLAVDATRVDRLGRTTDVLAFVVAQVFGAGDRPVPERAAVEEALAASRDEHRRLHLGVLP